MAEFDRFGGIVEDQQQPQRDRFGGIADPGLQVQESIVQAATGFNEGLAEVLGAPVDIVTSGLNFIAEQAGLPEIEDPIGGSESLKGLLESAGVMREARPGFEFERRVGKEIGATIPAITGIGALARTAQIATRGAPTLGQTLIAPAVQRPAATAAAEVVAATGAGTGGAIAEQVAPGSTSAEITGQIVGGLLPSLTPTGLVVRGGRAIARRFSSEAKRKAAVQQVRDVFGGEITEKAAQRIAESQAIGAEIPGLKLSTAEASGSPALIATQRIRESNLSGLELEQAIARQENNVSAINDFAQSLSPTGITNIDVVVDRAKGNIDNILRDVEQARGTQPIPTKRPNLSEVGQSIRDSLIRRRREASVSMSRLANNMGLNEVDLTPQFDEIRENLIETMTPSGRFADKANTPDMVNVLKADRSINATTTFEDLKTLREELGADFRGAISGTAPDQKKARFLKMGIAQLDDALDSLQFPGDLNTRYKQFRQSYFDTVIAPFERNAAFKVKQKGARGQFTIDDERVASTFFGPNKETDMRQFVGVFKDDPEQMAAMRSVIMDEFNKSVVRDGEIKPKLMSSWLNKFDGTLDQIPNVKNELSNIASANAALNRRNSSLDLRQRQVEDSLLSRKLRGFSQGTQSGSDVVSAAIENPKLMKQLVNRLRGDTDSLTSLRRHVWDNIVAGDADVMMANITANKDALLTALGKKHMDDVDTIMKAREIVERSVTPTGTAIRTSPLAAVERLAGISVPAFASRIYAIESGRIGARFMLTEMASRFFRGVSNRDMQRLMDTALYDPEIAKDMASAIKFPNTPAPRNKMKKHLFNLGLVSDEEIEDRVGPPLVINIP